MFRPTFILAVAVFCFVLIASTGVDARPRGLDSPPVQIGIGAWAPNNTDEWNTGAAIWVSGQKGPIAGRLLVGSADDASELELGDFTMAEVSLEYRLKPLSNRNRHSTQKGFDWYAGIGVAYFSMWKNSDNLEVNDSAFGPAASFGMTWGSFGIDIHAWRGKDSVDLGGTTFSLSYAF